MEGHVANLWHEKTKSVTPRSLCRSTLWRAGSKTQASFCLALSHSASLCLCLLLSCSLSFFYLFFSPSIARGGWPGPWDVCRLFLPPSLAPSVPLGTGARCSARRLLPSLIFTSASAPVPWQLKGGDLATDTLRCPRFTRRSDARSVLAGDGGESGREREKEKKRKRKREQDDSGRHGTKEQFKI